MMGLLIFLAGTFMRRGKVMLVTTKAMKNPRSALCKTSIMASTDIFSSSLGHTLLLNTSTNKDGAFDQLVWLLLPLIYPVIFFFFFLKTNPPGCL